MIGDAIHIMTPGRGVGANTAPRDAALLCRNLAAARDGQMGLIAAVRDYETQMREYGYAAVLKSREQMDGNGILHKSLMGRIALEGMRAGMRFATHVPVIKRRMAAGLERERGASQVEPIPV